MISMLLGSSTGTDVVVLPQSCSIQHSLTFESLRAYARALTFAGARPTLPSSCTCRCIRWGRRPMSKSVRTVLAVAGLCEVAWRKRKPSGQLANWVDAAVVGSGEVALRNLCAPSGPELIFRRDAEASDVAPRAGVPSMSPRWPRAFRPLWRTFVGWSAYIPVGHDPTGSSGRQPEPEAGVRERSTTAGPGGGAALGGEASAAPPPIFSAPAAFTDSREHREWPVDAGHCTRVPALITTPRQPAATAHGSPPATRVRVVLLPHARTQPSLQRGEPGPSGTLENRHKRASEGLLRDFWASRWTRPVG
jgi:hypothetical protein